MLRERLRLPILVRPIHTAPPVTMALHLPITLLILLQALCLVPDPDLPLPANAPPASTGCLIQAGGVWPMVILMYHPAHLIIPPGLQPLKQGHIIVAARLMTPLLKNVKTVPVLEGLIGTVANV